jgi:hypothetical protein
MDLGADTPVISLAMTVRRLVHCLHLTTLARISQT